MKAIMLAAGKGIRCYPLTYLYPKLLQQVCGIPVLEYMLSWFNGMPEIDKLYILVSQESRIEGLNRYVENRGSYLLRIVELFSRLGYKVEYRNPNLTIEVIKAGGRGTGGDLRFALDTITAKGTLDKDLIVCNADYVTVRRLADGALSPQIDLADIVQYHRAGKQALGIAMTVALVNVSKKDARRFGIARIQQVNNFHLINGFVEKPETKAVPPNPLVNAGIYVIDRDFILSHLDRYLPDKSGTDLERTLIGQLADEAKPKLAAYLLDLYRWFDIGTPEQVIDVNICIAREGRNSLIRSD